MECHSWCLTPHDVHPKSFFFFFLIQQKRPESPLDSTNPFLEDEPGEDVGTEKDEDLTKVS